MVELHSDHNTHITAVQPPKLTLETVHMHTHMHTHKGGKKIKEFT